MIKTLSMSDLTWSAVFAGSAGVSPALLLALTLNPIINESGAYTLNGLKSDISLQAEVGAISKRAGGTQSLPAKTFKLSSVVSVARN
jgi:hypothetical protein